MGMTFKDKKSFWKERQILYENLKNFANSSFGKEFEYNGSTFIKASEDTASHVFVWFDRKPFLAVYYSKRKYFWIGNQRFFLRSAKEKSKIITFVTETWEYDNSNQD